MEDCGEALKSMKNNINQLKDQVSQILKALTSLQNTMIAQNKAAHSTYPLAGQRNKPNQEFSPYGLPINYEQNKLSFKSWSPIKLGSSFVNGILGNPLHKTFRQIIQSRSIMSNHMLSFQIIETSNKW